MDTTERHEDFALDGENGLYWARCTRANCGMEWLVAVVDRCSSSPGGLSPEACPFCGEPGKLIRDEETAN